MCTHITDRRFIHDGWSCYVCCCLYIFISLGCGHELRFRLWKRSVTNGEFEIVHVRQQSSMLIISPHRCTRRRFVACIRPWGVSSRGAARVRFEWFDLSCFSIGEVLLFCSFLQSKQQGGRCYRAMGYLCEDGVIDFV